MLEVEFPAWIRLTHFVNIIFLSFLIRSGMEILATHPKLYFNDHAKPGSEWARFTKKKMPKDRLFTALDEEEDYASTISMPGHINLGLGRAWHFISGIGWILCGVIYVALLFLTGEWQRLVPTSWSIFPTALDNIVTYLNLQAPETLAGQPYNALQKLTYFAVVFLLAPLQILTAGAQSPAVEGRFQWYVKMFGGRQGARSLHFIGLAAFVAFTIGHVALVVIEGEIAAMVFGSAEASMVWAYIISGIALSGLIVLHIVATQFTLSYKRLTQRALGFVVNGVRRALLHGVESRQSYPASAITPNHRVNGYPPSDETYKKMAAESFEDYRLEIGGMVENPMSLKLAELQALPKTSQTVLHNCIQGWTSIGQWGGVPLREIIEMAGPKPDARYVYFHSMQDQERDEYNPKGEGHFYEVMDLELADHDQTILAYEMNEGPLPVEHGAPLRLRLENSVGFKMIKWIDRIELIDDYSEIGEGMGGSREDWMYYDKEGEV